MSSDFSAVIFLVVFVLMLPLLVALPVLGISELGGEAPPAWATKLVQKYLNGLARSFGLFERTVDGLARVAWVAFGLMVVLAIIAGAYRPSPHCSAERASRAPRSRLPRLGHRGYVARSGGRVTARTRSCGTWSPASTGCPGRNT